MIITNLFITTLLLLREILVFEMSCSGRGLEESYPVVFCGSSVTDSIHTAQVQITLGKGDLDVGLVNVVADMTHSIFSVPSD
jgi:hypothetical protein